MIVGTTIAVLFLCHTNVDLPGKLIEADCKTERSRSTATRYQMSTLKLHLRMVLRPWGLSGELTGVTEWIICRESYRAHPTGAVSP